MERLARLRAPLAVVALVALTLVVLGRVALGLSELVPGGSREVAAARLAPNGSDGALTVLAGVLVVCCFVAPEVAARRRLAVWGVVLAAASLVASVAALALTNLELAGWSVVWLLPDLVVPVVVGVALVGAARRTPGVEASPAPEPAPAVEATPPPRDPDLEPAWSEDAAAGAVWRTAGEAARGVPAAGWGGSEPSPWSAPALPPGPSATPPASGASSQAGSERPAP